jgi:hypothetical protein
MLLTEGCGARIQFEPEGEQIMERKGVNIPHDCELTEAALELVVSGASSFNAPRAGALADDGPTEDGSVRG